MVLCWKKSTEDPDSAWKAQNKAEETNPVYKYMNLGGKGLLLDIYFNGLIASYSLIPSLKSFC